MEQSVKGKLNVEDLKKWLRNTLVFLAPVALIYLGFVVNNIDQSGFSWTAFSPNSVVIGSMVLYVMNVAIDFLKKLISGPKQ